MESEKKVGPTVIVIFGATGDLTWRKLVPAIYNLYLDKWIPENFSMIGIGHTDQTEADFRKHLHDGVDQFSRKGKTQKKEWDTFAQCLTYYKGEFTDKSTYNNVEKQIKQLEKTWGTAANRIFYMAVPPMYFEQIATSIGASGMAKDKEKCRIVIEKPFGYDLDSAKKLNTLLHSMYDESQIYRMFEPIWNRNYIEHVQITVSEQLGVENRGNYYETAGALRDMIQNHILQLLCLIAMEPPVSFIADEIRNRKVDVLNALRKFADDEVHHNAVRGQYGPGWIEGKKVIGYRQEPDINKDSVKETFAAVKFLIDNWRWQGVPFYVRTGKRMNETISIITIQFRPVPHQ